jgi:hypothetical protein
MHQRCEELALEPLTEAAIAQYLAECFQRNRFPTELHRLLEKRTEGHPLLLSRSPVAGRSRGAASDRGRLVLDFSAL